MSPLALFAGLKTATNLIDRIFTPAPSRPHTSPADSAEAKRSFAEALLQQLDANGNGVLRPEESGIPGQTFARLDKNGDGVLDAEEMEKGLRAFMVARRNEAALQARFAELDANHDGVLTAAEAGLRAPAFAKADADLDGAISLDEFRSRGLMG